MEDTIETCFETRNDFRMLAPWSVARGMLALGDGTESVIKQKEHAAAMMNLIEKNVPEATYNQTSRNGKVTTVSAPKYKAIFTDTMIKEAEAYYNTLSVERAHKKRMENVRKYFETFKPTISLGEALYRLSFYLISNKNNLAKSTNNLISFAKKLLLEQPNNMLVDSAIMIGGQGKSTIQQGLISAVRKMGMSSSMCHLPSVQDGVQEAFVRNEVCVDDETTFQKLDIDSLNKILDKSDVTIKGKYVKEWQAKSISNVLVGTNFLPSDVNTRRYSIRMVDENFRLPANYGRWTIPGKMGDEFGDSYDLVKEWVEEGWLHLFYYCNKYEIPKCDFEEVAFDYNLQYRIKKAFDAMDSQTPVASIDDLIKLMEQAEGDKIDYRTKYSLKGKLYILANQLKLNITEKHKNMFSIYDWSKAMEIDETDLDVDTLERVYCFFHSDRFEGLCQ